jgi:hypothetical protein
MVHICNSRIWETGRRILRSWSIWATQWDSITHTLGIRSKSQANLIAFLRDDAEFGVALDELRKILPTGIFCLTRWADLAQDQRPNGLESEAGAGNFGSKISSPNAYMQLNISSFSSPTNISEQRKDSGLVSPVSQENVFSTHLCVWFQCLPEKG